MRSLSLLLLDKNTQGVNSHGLVGGLIGGFKYEGEVGSNGIKDFDEVKKTGFYIVSIWDDTVSNKPNISYGIMLVLNTQTYMFQEVFDLFSSTINFRAGNGSYGSWKVK